MRLEAPLSAFRQARPRYARRRLRRDELKQVGTPMSTSKRFIQQTVDERTGLIENAALDTRVCLNARLLDRVTVDGREEHAVAIWRMATDDGVTGRLQ